MWVAGDANYGTCGSRKKATERFDSIFPPNICKVTIDFNETIYLHCFSLCGIIAESCAKEAIEWIK
jgi:hypothetical protein